MAKIKKTISDEPCILNDTEFKYISAGDKARFVKAAKKLNISQQDLLKLAVQAAGKGKIEFKTKTTIELA